MIGIGLIRADLLGDKEIDARYTSIIEEAAARDGAQLMKIVTYTMETLDLALYVLADAGDDVTVYTPGRVHVAGAEKAILQYAALTCVLDNAAAWPRTAS